MAKITTTDLTSITNDASATTTINNNFQAIEDALNSKVLYRANPVGEVNQMSNDLDMNSNDILNAASVTTTSLTVNGITVDNLASEAAASAAGALASESAAAAVASLYNIACVIRLHTSRNTSG